MPGLFRTPPSAKTDPDWVHFRWAKDVHWGTIYRMNSEWILFVYPVALIGYLILAARWQPKTSRADGHQRRPQHER